MTDKEALDFIAAAVIAEAKQQNVDLSDEDKRLLYFSAVDPSTAAGISEARLQSVDEGFEEKVTGLLIAAVQNPNVDKQRFEEAVRTLKRGDFYILVMVAAARNQQSRAEHRTRDIVLYLLIAVAIVAGVLVYALLTE